jgi:polar amino acid transport system substrate-binding protein
MLHTVQEEAVLPRFNRQRRSTAVVGLALAALTLAACGSDDDAGTQTDAGEEGTSQVDQALADLVPDEISEDGTITIGTDPTYAPNEFLDTDGSTVIGFDVDLFNAVAAKLGLDTEWVASDFSDIIPGVGSAKYEIGVSSFTINAERLETVDMVSYFSAGTQWAVKSGNPSGVDPDAACGKKVAVQTGTVQETDDLPVRNQACTGAGQPEITIEPYQAQDQATAAVVSGKDDAVLADSPVMAYAVQQTNGQLELLGEIYDAAPYGYVIEKDQGDFGQAIADALAALIEDGTYAEILDEYGVGDGAIDDPQVNPSV